MKQVFCSYSYEEMEGVIPLQSNLAEAFTYGVFLDAYI